MRCPTLCELPSAPPGKTGWPWTEENPRLPDVRPDGSPWPKLSIIMATFNAAEFFEESLRSALLQGYPNLEIVVIDGASTDGTVDLIHKYEPWIAYWVSEPDRGQSHATNKGFAAATGVWLGWLNADDTYVPGILTRLGSYLAHPEAVDLVYGDVRYTDETGKLRDIFQPREFSIAAMAEGGMIHTPSVFWQRRLNVLAGPVSEQYQVSADNDFWMRVVPHARCRYAPGVMSTFRRHEGSKTVQAELKLVQETYLMFYGYLEQEPYASAVSEQDKRRILGGYLWATGVLLQRSGRTAEALPCFQEAIERYRLLKEAPQAAAFRTVRQPLEDHVVRPEQMNRTLDVLPIGQDERRRFSAIVWEQYDQLRFYGGFKRGEPGLVLQSAVPLACRGPRHLLQRGFVSICTRSALAYLKQVTHAA